ncbi:MAG: efflux RND transporter periplasmic adaptor subunit [Thermodesulfobacteriota bacterium]|nr:efflux RND transporter periplasmic adaptor subunit [Thermodesulfobacteriota bacterium]
MQTRRKTLFHAALAGGFIVGGIGIMMLLTLHKPPVEKEKPKPHIPFVKTMMVQVGPRPVVIPGEGTVTFARTTRIAPQVGGRVVAVSDRLVNGGRFQKGDVLFSIEKTDYELAVTLARASVKNAESNLMEAEEMAAAAKREWRIEHGADTGDSPAPSPLALKEPQRIAARAALSAQHANLEKAVLNLQRTDVSAPYDCVVIEENIDIGQVVAPNQVVASVGGIDAVEIVVPLEKQKLAWFDIPGVTTSGLTGADARAYADMAGQTLKRTGRITRAFGRIDERTRMARVVVRITEPYDTFPPFYAGLFAGVEIIGHTLPEAVYIPRPALHDGDTVWLVDADNQLVFRHVTVAATDPKTDRALIVKGLEDGDQVVISILPTATQGMRVNPHVETPVAGDASVPPGHRALTADNDTESTTKTRSAPATPSLPPFLTENKNGGWAIKGLYFAPYSINLTTKDRDILDGVALFLQELPDKKIEVRGHTDNSGDARQNRKLSGQRADAVRQYLISKGISAERLSAVGYGDKMPVAANDTAHGRAANRRVTLHPQDTGTANNKDRVAAIADRIKAANNPGEADE